MAGHWGLAALVSAVLIQTHAVSALQCMCSTHDCKRDNEISCEAQSMCYVQYFPEFFNPSKDGDSEDGASWGAGISSVIRGCIDDRTPLLCENRRPHSYTGTWPVLLCCNNEDWCNRGVMPTTPPWLEEWQKQRDSDRDRPLINPDISSFPESDPPGSYDGIPLRSQEQPQSIDSSSYPDLNEHVNRMKSYTDQKYQDELQNRYATSRHSSQTTKTVNPLYIGVPVAGACVLLAIIIFAIYILKRHNEYLEDYNKRTAQLKQQSLIYDPPVIKHPPGKVVSGCKKNCLYPECDRSSNGSETRLLMRV